MIPLVLPMILAIVSADMVFIILLGLAFMGALTTGSRIKGLVSGGLGLLVAFIGVQTVTAGARFTFGSDYLYAGIGLVPLLLGIFAIPEAIGMAVEGGTIAKTRVIIKGMHDVWEGAKDTFRHWTVWLRSTIIGYIIGIIPGVGAMAATFIVYGQAKQTSKHPERFGTGIVEGVIAPESANNAKEAGALLTTLALGIPGSASMAILLGAFLMLGLIPGPEMMTEHLDLSLTLLLVIVVANLLAVAICFPAAPYLAKVAYIPSRILVPLVLVIALVGVFAFRELFNDVIVTAIFSVLGIAMRRFGFNRPALVLGFVLGGLFEKYIFIAYRVAGPLFFMRPISLTLIFIIIALFTYGPIKNLFQHRRGAKRA
jgi:TctA family transporter